MNSKKDTTRMSGSAGIAQLTGSRTSQSAMFTTIRLPPLHGRSTPRPKPPCTPHGSPCDESRAPCTPSRTHHPRFLRDRLMPACRSRGNTLTQSTAYVLHRHSSKYTIYNMYILHTIHRQGPYTLCSTPIRMYYSFYSQTSPKSAIVPPGHTVGAV